MGEVEIDIVEFLDSDVDDLLDDHVYVAHGRDFGHWDVFGDPLA